MKCSNSVFEIDGSMISLSSADKKASSSSGDANSRKRFRGAEYSSCVYMYNVKHYRLIEKAITADIDMIYEIGGLRTC